MPYCSNCGAEVDPGERYCPECGEPVAQNAQADSQAGGGRNARQGATRQGQQGEYERSARGTGGHQSRYDWNGAGYPRRPDRNDTDVIGARIVAQIVDNLVMFVLFFVILIAFGSLGAAAGDQAGGGIFGLGLLLGFAGSIFYGFLLEGYWDGYTVGKKLMGIKVVKESGESCTYGAALLRNLLEIVDGFFYYVVGFISMAASDKRQRIGDHVASTVVVRETPD